MIEARFKTYYQVEANKAIKKACRKGWRVKHMAVSVGSLVGCMVHVVYERDEIERCACTQNP